MKAWIIRGVVGLVIGGPWQVAAAQTPDETIGIIRDAAAAQGVSGDWMVAIGRCESTLNPRAVGRLGERGLFQLRSPGLLDRFWAMGYSDPFNAWEAAAFTAWALAHGLASHWTCAR